MFKTGLSSLKGAVIFTYDLFHQHYMNVNTIDPVCMNIWEGKLVREI